jgi:hypothetical protein
MFERFHEAGFLAIVFGFSAGNLLKVHWRGPGPEAGHPGELLNHRSICDRSRKLLA